jgi:hypothetical protein
MLTTADSQQTAGRTGTGGAVANSVANTAIDVADAGASARGLARTGKAKNAEPDRLGRAATHRRS